MTEKKLFQACLAVLMTLVVTSLAANQKSIDYETYFQRLDALEKSRAAIEILEQALDRSQIDPAAKTRALAGAPDALAAFVRDEVVWQPYPGSLRGARGTLIARAGNALDQSVLLATLINRAGWDARIARGELGEADARLLLASAKASGEHVPALADDQIAELRTKSVVDSALIDTYMETLERSDSASQLNLEQRATRILNALGDSVPPETADLPDWVLPATRDYWWVQYRTEPAAAWQDLHPAFPGEAPSSLSGAEEVFSDNVPKEHVQRVTLRLMMKIRRAERSDTLTLAELEEIPAASLEKDPVALSITPNALLSVGEGSSLRDKLAQSDFVFFTLNDKRSHNPVTLNGQVLPDDALSPQSFGSAEVFANLAAAGEAASSALSEDEEDLFGIEDLRLKIISEAPHIGRRETVRILYNPLLPDGSLPERTRVEIAAGVAGSYLITAHSGAMSESALLQSFVDFAKARLPVLEQIHHATFDPDVSGMDILRSLAESDVTLPLKLLSFMETQAPVSATGAIPVRPHLRMYAAEPVLGKQSNDDRMRASIDLFQTPAIALSTNGESVHPRAAFNAGLWSSHLETLLLPEGETGSLNTTTVHARALDAGIAFTTLEPGEELDGELDFPRESIAAIERDLADGFAVLAPVALADGQEQAAWWRIHPQTGEALAMFGSGRGIDTAEYAQFLSTTMVLVDVVTFQYGFGKCLGGNKSISGATVACCLVDNSISLGRGAGALNVAKLRHPAMLFGAAFLYVNMYVAGQFMDTPLDCQG